MYDRTGSWPLGSFCKGKLYLLSKNRAKKTQQNVNERNPQNDNRW